MSSHACRPHPIPERRVLYDHFFAIMYSSLRNQCLVVLAKYCLCHQCSSVLRVHVES